MGHVTQTTPILRMICDFWDLTQGPRKVTKSGGSKRALMASAGARAYNGGLGEEPPAGSRGRAPGQGVRGRSPPEAEKLFAFRRPLEAANLP